MHLACELGSHRRIHPGRPCPANRVREPPGASNAHARGLRRTASLHRQLGEVAGRRLPVAEDYLPEQLRLDLAEAGELLLQGRLASRQGCRVPLRLGELSRRQRALGHQRAHSQLLDVVGERPPLFLEHGKLTNDAIHPLGHSGETARWAPPSHGAMLRRGAPAVRRRRATLLAPVPRRHDHDPADSDPGPSRNCRRASRRETSTLGPPGKEPVGMVDRCGSRG